MDERTAQLLAEVRGARDVPDEAWRELFAADPLVATSAAFDLLAGEPRIKPSTRLLIDPDDSARRRWDRRVSAAVALLAAPVAARVFDELRDELIEDADLAVEVLARSTPSAALTAAQREALRALSAATGRT